MTSPTKSDELFVSQMLLKNYNVFRLRIMYFIHAIMILMYDDWENEKNCSVALYFYVTGVDLPQVIDTHDVMHFVLFFNWVFSDIC